MSGKESTEVRKGLEGVIASESKICKIDGIKGRLYYRGYRIEDLAKGNFEETAYLLMHEKLPNKKELAEFSSELVRHRSLPDHVIKMMKTFAKRTTPMEALRTVVSSLADNEPDVRKLSTGDLLNTGIKLAAKFPTIVAYYYRINHGERLIKPDPKLGHAANFLYMLKGKRPSSVEEKAMDMDFVLHAEHGFNASTFALRVTVSTLSDMYSAFTSGIGTLKGPLHGGAAQEVMKMMAEIKEPKNVERYVKNILAKHGRIMGFGHRIYKTYDPRARVLNGMALEISKEKGNLRYYEIAQRLERIMAADKNLYPNVDFYSAIVYHHLGLPLDIDTPIFAIARTAGWVAHAIEQYGDNRLIRPIELYTGPLDLKYIPIDRRG